MYKFSLFFLVLIALVGCGGGSSGSSVKELSLDTGSDPVVSSKSYKPSANLVLDQDKLLENLKKQHFQTEVALVTLPEDSSFELATNLVGSAGGFGGGIIVDDGIAVSNASTKKSKQKRNVALKGDVSDLMASVQISGTLQNYSISSIEGNKISFSQYYYYYFIRPSYANDYPAIFLRVNDSNKTIEKVLSDDTNLVFHVYEDNRTIGFTTPKGKSIQIQYKDSVTGESSTLELAFNEELDDIKSLDGGVNEDLTLSGSASADSASESAPSADTSDTSKGAEFTDTNNQVEGISEADHVKTDGSYIYSLTYNTLKVYDISKEDFISTLEINFDSLGFGESRETSSDAIKSADVAVDLVYYAPYVSSQINLVNGNIVVFSQYGEKTVISYIDISNKEAPSMTKQLVFNESLVSSRIVDGKIVLVMNDYLYPTQYIEMPYHYAFTTEQQTKFKAANEALVAGLTLADFSMDLSFEKTAGDTTESVSYLDANDIYFDENSGGYSLSKIIVLDSDANVTSASGVLTDYTQNIYVTANSVYMYNTTWESRIEWWNFDWIGSQKTMIYYFDIQSSTLDYKGGIEVSGYPNGTFSFHEKDNNLFMAFHDDATGDNGIHTISIGEELTNTNTLSGLAAGESLQSVRFIEDKAYLVTFKFVDPLIAVDLSVPEAPVVLGELKVTGFSSYLHGIYDGVLLGVGYEADESGMITGAKISTFDVSSSTPTEVDKAGITNTYSSFNASYDHHAFTWYKSHNLLALPYSGEKAGAIVYKLDETGAIIEAATIESPNTSSDYYYYSSYNSRIIFVNDTLYFVDGGLIKAYPIDTLEFSADNKNLTIESQLVVEPIVEELTIDLNEQLPVE